MKLSLKKPILISLSPNTSFGDVFVSFLTLLWPFGWKSGGALQRVKSYFTQLFSSDHLMFYDSGRTALSQILKSFTITNGDEVLLQALTCVVVPNPVLWQGATPVYVDIDPETFNMDLDDLINKITPRSKAIIIQHTFGNPANMNRVQEIAKQHNLIVIEDAAHALFEKDSSERIVGTIGDAGFFSFGRDKVISSVYGGMAWVRDPKVFQRLSEQYARLQFPTIGWIFGQLMHPILFALIKPLYYLGFGKVILVAAQKIGLLSKAVYGCEKNGQCHVSMPRKYPNALARLLENQLKKQEKICNRRKEIGQYYLDHLIHSSIVHPQDDAGSSGFLRYSIRTPFRDEILIKGHRAGIFLGDWYTREIIPIGTDYNAIGYDPKSTPQVTLVARDILNLPTMPSLRKKDLKRVVSLVLDTIGEM